MVTFGQSDHCMSHLHSTKSLLVYADDDEDDLLLVKEAMAAYTDTLEVCLFESGYKAYSFLLELEQKAEKPCLVILDMNMPGMSAKELLPILRSIPFYKDVPIILFTTSSMKPDYQFALEHDAGFITKPMNYSQMDLIAEQFIRFCSDEVKGKIKR